MERRNTQKSALEREGETKREIITRYGRIERTEKFK